MATQGNSIEIEPFLTYKKPLSASIVSGNLVRMNLPEATLFLADSVRNETGQLISAEIVPPPVYAEVASTRTESIGDNWFDRLHIIPRRIDAGNILTVQTRVLDLFNAFIYESRDLEQFINNAGAGTSITDLPSLPTTIPALKSLLMTLEITPDGAPTINTTLDFDTDETYLLSIPITGTRIVMFPFEPEAPLTERLLFLTDVLEATDGTEQRVSLRLAPRQEFTMRLLREDGPERQRVDFLMFDWQSRVFGLPVWIEPAFLTAAATSGQTVINVDTTATGDFRVDGLAIVFESEDKFDALEVDAVGPTSITFKTPIANNYDPGVRVMPLRTAITSVPIKEKRYAVNLAEFEIVMRVLDNDVDLSDTSGWPTFNGKVLLSDPNAIEQTLDGDLNKVITVFDGSTGKFSQASTQPRSRRGSAKTFLTRDRAGLWKVRRLLHALRGRQVSFYLPTFTQDLTLAVPYPSGDPALTIVNVGYARYAKNRQPKANIRIILNNGTIYERNITNSAEVDSATEQVTLSSSIAQNIDPSDIYRIEFYEKVRIDNEEITIEHRTSNGEAKVGFPVKVVLE